MDLILRMALVLAGAFGQGFSAAGASLLPNDQPTSASASGIKYIYVVPSSHANLGGPMHGEWRGEIAKVWEKSIIDDAIETCRSEPRFRWTIGAFWMFQAWWENTPDEGKRKEMLDLVRHGRISVSAPSHNYRSAYLPGELVNRVCYDAQAFADRFAICFDTAVMNDVPGWNWSLVQPLAKSGVRYFLAGANYFAGGRLTIPPKDNPFWWEGPDGSRVLTWISDSYAEGMTRVFVDPSSARFFAGAGNLQGFEKEDLARLGTMDDRQIMEFGIRREIQRLEKAGYPYDAILVLHAHDFIDSQNFRAAMRPIREWNAAHEFPQIVVATPEMFFRHIEKRFAQHIPVYAGDWAGRWESEPQADSRLQSVRNYVDGHAPVLEKLASVSEVLGITPYPRSELDRLNRVHLELHDQGVVGDPQVLAAGQSTSDLIRFLLGRLANAMATQDGAIVVFNPSSWARSDNVSVSVPASLGVNGALHLWDADTSEIVAPRLEADPEDSESRLMSFIAKNVPPVGYRVLSFRVGRAPDAATSHTTPNECAIENSFYTVRVNPRTGDIAGIFDKETQRELVNAAAKWRFNRLAESQDGYYGIRKSMSASIETVSASTDGDGAAIHVLRRRTPHVRTEIRLPVGLKRIAIRNWIDMPESRTNRSIYYLYFPFALDQGLLSAHIENANAFLSPGKTFLPGAYQARFVTTGATDLREGDAFGVAVAQPQTSVFFLEGDTPVFVSTVRPFPLLWRNPFGAEPQRRFVCDYSITSYPGPFDPVQVGRLGEEASVPLAAAYLAPSMLRRTGALQVTARSYLSVSAPNVVLRAWKLVERGEADECLLRFQEVAGRKETPVEVRSPFEFRHARLADVVEHPLPGPPLPTDPLRFTIRAHETVSIRVAIKRASPDGLAAAGHPS